MTRLCTNLPRTFSGVWSMLFPVGRQASLELLAIASGRHPIARAAVDFFPMGMCGFHHCS